MADARNPSSHADDPHGPVMDVTAARGAERRGIYRILLISTVLAIVAVVLVWLVISSGAHVSPPHVGPAGQPATRQTTSSP